MSLAFLAAGCSRQAAVPVVTDGIVPAVDYGDLAEVLDKAVDDGLLDGEGLAERRDRLEVQLKRLAVTGPTATPRLLPTAEDRLAYWYNARAAWAMELALLAGCPRKRPCRGLTGRPFVVDRREMTLADVDAAIEADGGWRAVVAAPGVQFDRARLPGEPFAPRGIRRRIADRFNEFIDDEDRFVIDVRRRTVRVPGVLWQYRRRLTAAHNRKYRTTGAELTTALLPYVAGSALRRLQDAIGYSCRPSRRGNLLAVVED